MIFGQFNKSGVPIVRASLLLHGLETAQLVGRAQSELLVDTGSYRSMLSESYLIQFGIIPQQFREFVRQTESRAQKFYGVGDGEITGHPIDAEVFLWNGRPGSMRTKAFCFKFQPLIVRRYDGAAMPNSLGRDVLGRLKMHHDPRARLSFKQKSWDGASSPDR